MSYKILKRNGTLVDFDASKIVQAIGNAMIEANEMDYELAETIAFKIENEQKEKSVSDIERRIIGELYRANFNKSAEAYSEYKTRRDIARLKASKERKYLTKEFLNKYKHAQDPFKNELGKFVYYRTYSRPIPEENRRERWWETVARVVDFNLDLEVIAAKKQGIKITPAYQRYLKEEAEEMYDMMYNLKLFPSGRTLWVGGTPSSYLYPLSNFNCSFVTIDNFDKFSEIFFVLMLGTGVGLSVERKYVNKLPMINTGISLHSKAFEPVPKTERTEHTQLIVLNNTAIEIIIGDSKAGWAEAIKHYFDIISSRQYSDIKYIFVNYNNVRPAGERLKTFGGFASGHVAIKQMFEKMNKLFQHRAKGEKWYKVRPLDALDIATIIAENVVAGGTRRSAEIVFCDPDETEVLEAKSNIYTNVDGNWVANQEILHRFLSNNTVFYNRRPTKEELHKQFETMRYSGEPAVANFTEMQRRRKDVQGGNPCFEILLRDRGVCNLTEVNMMGFIDEDGVIDYEGLYKAQELSARIGYRMATIELELHDWNVVNEEDRLTGCSITGVMDFKNAAKMNNEEFAQILEELREIAHDSAYELADSLNMNRPLLVTAVKPSGTISQVAGVSSGVHFSHSPYYVRRVRVSANDPLANAMVAAGFPWDPEVGSTVEEHKTKVFSFPMRAPEGKTKYDVSAVEQLELYKLIMENYVDHNASNTIHVRDHEWPLVEEWVYNNWDDLVGVTFLSLDDNFYQLAPYESITPEQYDAMIAAQPRFSANILSRFEDFSQEFELDADCDTGACPVR